MHERISKVPDMWARMWLEVRIILGRTSSCAMSERDKLRRLSTTTAVNRVFFFSLIERSDLARFENVTCELHR